MGNANLHRAKRAKNDEFYTRLCDIEAECQHYDFRGKVIFCPCDDVTWSQFARYFAQNFHKLGLKKLICSCYYPEGDLLESAAKRGYWAEYDGQGDFEAWLKNPKRHYFKAGGGDFRSAEVTELLEKADFVVTNPPFSLFTDFFFWLIDSGKKFLVMFPQTSIFNRRIFPYFLKREVVLGKSIRTHGRWFRVPDFIPLLHPHHSRQKNGVKECEVDSARWATNIKIHGQRENFLELTEKYTPERYPKFDNLDVINVDKKGEIPKDYFEIMAVPTCFINYWSPEQFHLLGIAGQKETLKINGKPKYMRLLIQRVT